MCSLYAYVLLSTALSYASSCPVPTTVASTVVHWVWCLCYLVQIGSAVAVFVILGMSASKFNLLLAGDCAALVQGRSLGGAGGCFAFLFCVVWLYRDNDYDDDECPWGPLIVGAISGAIIGILMGYICDGHTVPNVFTFLTFVFHPVMVALMANVFVGCEVLEVAEAVGKEEQHTPGAQSCVLWDSCGQVRPGSASSTSPFRSQLQSSLPCWHYSSAQGSSAGQRHSGSPPAHCHGVCAGSHGLRAHRDTGIGRRATRST